MTNTTNLGNKKIKTGNWNVFQYETIDSTNEEIKRLYNKVRDKKIIVVADEQSQGKGRYKRKWISPKNSGLYASWLLFNYEGEVEILPILTGLTCIKCLEEYCSEKFLLKWPNDLILSNKKLGGVLIEKYKGSVIVGIGINLIPREELPLTSISLNQSSSFKYDDFKLLRDNILFDITKKLENNLNHLRVNGPEMFLDEVNKYLTMPIGHSIRFIKDNTVFNAKVVGLGQGGRLKVELENKKVITLNSEEVSLNL